MNVKKYLLIVICTTFIFTIFAAGIVGYDYLNSNFGTGGNMPDGGNDEHVEGLEPVEASKPYNILVLGVDVEAKLTDVMMLCRIDPIEHKVDMLSIPRDTRIKISGRNAKINSSFNHGGVEKVLECVKELTDLPVHHYFLVNTKAFRDTVDALGGVYFDVPRRMEYTDPLQDLYIDLYPGYQLLDGDKAEQLIRFRRYPNGDIDRIAVQQEFIKELIAQKLQVSNIANIPRVYNIIVENSNTDMTLKEMLNAGKQLLGVPSENFTSHTVPGVGEYVGAVSYYLHNETQLKALIETSFK